MLEPNADCNWCSVTVKNWLMSDLGSIVEPPLQIESQLWYAHYMFDEMHMRRIWNYDLCLIVICSHKCEDGWEYWLWCCLVLTYMIYIHTLSVRIGYTGTLTLTLFRYHGDWMHKHIDDAWLLRYYRCWIMFQCPRCKIKRKYVRSEKNKCSMLCWFDASIFSYPFSFSCIEPLMNFVKIVLLFCELKLKH